MYTSAPFRAADPLLAQLGTTASFSSPSSSASSPPDARPAVDTSPSLHLRTVAADTSASTSTSTSAWPSAASSASASTSTAPSAAAASSSTAARAPSRPRPLRFHACERRWKCDHVWQDGLGSYSFEPAHLPLLGGPKRLKRPGSGEVLPGDQDGRGAAPRVVYVNPSEMPRWRWDAYRDEVQGRIDEWRERQAAEVASGRTIGALGRDDGSGKEKKRERGQGGAEVELPGALVRPIPPISALCAHTDARARQLTLSCRPAHRSSPSPATLHSPSFSRSSPSSALAPSTRSPAPTTTPFRPPTSTSRCRPSSAHSSRPAARSSCATRPSSTVGTSLLGTALAAAARVASSSRARRRRRRTTAATSSSRHGSPR